MNQKINLNENIILIKRHPDFPYIYDIEIGQINFIKQFNSIECHLVVYPYDRKITSDDVKFDPYEESVKDTTSNQRSSYSLIQKNFNKFFGILLGSIIAIIFSSFKPDDLFSVQSILAIIGAYAIGKEIWDDLENFMIEITKNFGIRYIDDYYRFKLEKNTTLTNYSILAKKNKFGKYSLPAEKFDFIKHSNSQTVRLYFNMNDFKKLNDNSVHILSIYFTPVILENFEKHGHLLGIKLSFNKNHFFFKQCLEIFQSNDTWQNGCLDKHGKWHKDSIFFRKTIVMGRLKLFLKNGIIKGKNIIQFYNNFFI